MEIIKNKPDVDQNYWPSSALESIEDGKPLQEFNLADLLNNKSLQIGIVTESGRYVACAAPDGTPEIHFYRRDEKNKMQLVGTRLISQVGPPYIAVGIEFRYLSVPDPKGSEQNKAPNRMKTTPIKSMQILSVIQ